MSTHAQETEATSVMRPLEEGTPSLPTLPPTMESRWAPLLVSVHRTSPARSLANNLQATA